MNIQRHVRTSGRRPANVTLNSAMLDEAKALGINISQACEKGLSAELNAARKAKWLEENQEAMAEWNDWVDQNGLPLARYRQF
jgi:antitoxin CcdA